MEWVKRKIAEREGLRKHLRKVADGTDTLWKNLHLACGNSAQCYNENSNEGYAIITPLDAQFDVVFSLGARHGIRSNSDKRVSFELDTKQYQVMVRGISAETVLPLALNGDDQVYLMLNEGHATTANVAEHFLAPLFFPELSPRPEQ